MGDGGSEVPSQAWDAVLSLERNREDDEDVDARVPGAARPLCGAGFGEDAGLLRGYLGLCCPTHPRLRSLFTSSFRILFSSLSAFISLAAKSSGNGDRRSGMETRASYSTREALLVLL